MFHNDGYCNLQVSPADDALNSKTRNMLRLITHGKESSFNLALWGPYKIIEQKESFKNHYYRRLINYW